MTKQNNLNNSLRAREVRKMGDWDWLKTCRFELRMTKAQRDKLRKKASEIDVTESDYLRMYIDNENPKIVVFDSSDLHDIRWELNKQGNNLNQLVRQVNSNPIGVDSDYVRDVLEQEQETMQSLYDLLDELKKNANLTLDKRVFDEFGNRICVDDDYDGEYD